MRRTSRTKEGDSSSRPAGDYNSLFREILRDASRGVPRTDFLRKVSKMLVEFSGCDAVEVRLLERGKLLCCETLSNAKQSARLDVVQGKRGESGEIVPCRDIDSDLERICEDIACGRSDPSSPSYTKSGSFRVDNTKNPLELSSEACRWAGGRAVHIAGDFTSLAIIPIPIEDKNRCLLLMKSKQQDYFTPNDVESFEGIAQILGIAFAHRRAQVALRERVKELTCLYGIARVAAQPGISLEKILRETVELIAPGWLYPDIATARIVLDGRSYSTPGFQDDLQKLIADIVANGEKRGAVEVAYIKEMSELDEGPFLKEERNLIDAIAREVAIIIERRQAEEDKERLQEQLRHADRLATIGQLAAGVAHELNEPLSNILGFAQLAKKAPENKDQVAQDIEKIEAASLHAREVVKKLMIFARQTQPQKNQVNLSRIVEQGLYFLESRCAKAGIELERVLAPDLPEIIGDQGQLYQVLVNLVVNAIQAMPEGGRLTIRTARDETDVLLIVEDTGTGMDENVLKKAFIPFFTTKDVDEGTGLGLAVVHGIVASHGGSVNARSVVGQGSQFEVRLPISGRGKAKRRQGSKDAKE